MRRSRSVLNPRWFPSSHGFQLKSSMVLSGVIEQSPPIPSLLLPQLLPARSQIEVQSFDAPPLTHCEPSLDSLFSSPSLEKDELGKKGYAYAPGLSLPLRRRLGVRAKSLSRLSLHSAGHGPKIFVGDDGWVTVAFDTGPNRVLDGVRWENCGSIVTGPSLSLSSCPQSKCEFGGPLGE